MGNAIYRKTPSGQERIRNLQHYIDHSSIRDRGVFVKISDGDYQKWDGLPSTPVLTIDFPRQCIVKNQGLPPNLFICKDKYYHSGNNYLYASYPYKIYNLNGSVWELSSQGNGPITFVYDTGGVNLITQANNDIYADSTFTTVYFAKNTKDEERKRVDL